MNPVFLLTVSLLLLFFSPASAGFFFNKGKKKAEKKAKLKNLEGKNSGKVGTNNEAYIDFDPSVKNSYDAAHKSSPQKSAPQTKTPHPPRSPPLPRTPNSPSERPPSPKLKRAPTPPVNLVSTKPTPPPAWKKPKPDDAGPPNYHPPLHEQPRKSRSPSSDRNTHAFHEMKIQPDSKQKPIVHPKPTFKVPAEFGKITSVDKPSSTEPTWKVVGNSSSVRKVDTRRKLVTINLDNKALDYSAFYIRRSEEIVSIDEVPFYKQLVHITWTEANQFTMAFSQVVRTKHEFNLDPEAADSLAMSWGLSEGIVHVSTWALSKGQRQDKCLLTSVLNPTKLVKKIYVQETRNTYSDCFLFGCVVTDPAEVINLRTISDFNEKISSQDHCHAANNDNALFGVKLESDEYEVRIYTENLEARTSLFSFYENLVRSTESGYDDFSTYANIDSLR